MLDPKGAVAEGGPASFSLAGKVLRSSGIV